MNVYYLALAFFLIVIALGQQWEDNTADSMLLQENKNSTDSSAETTTSSQLIKDVDVTLEVAHLDNNTTARFKHADGTEAPLSSAKLVLYRILVHNSGTVPLSDIVLSAELAEGIQYEASKYYEDGRGDLKTTIEPDPSNGDLKTNVTWNLTFMNSGEIKSVLMEVYVKKEADETGVRVGVKGKASDGDEIWDSDSMPSDECYLRYIPGTIGEGMPCFPEDDICKKECPEWAKVI